MLDAMLRNREFREFLPFVPIPIRVSGSQDALAGGAQNGSECRCIVFRRGVDQCLRGGIGRVKGFWMNNRRMGDSWMNGGRLPESGVYPARGHNHRSKDRQLR